MPAHEAVMGEAQSCLACDSKRSNGTTSARKPVATTHIRCAVPERPPYARQASVTIWTFQRKRTERLREAACCTRKQPKDIGGQSDDGGQRWAQRKQNAVREN